MPEEGRTTVTDIEFGPPKYQATIPETARRVLGINDLDDSERAIVSAELTLEKVYDKNEE
jgi:bifunctional DNA-binding transcriptional regulator/antitoxin component of YhaV-PrlF toxin-antitoxin module